MTTNRNINRCLRLRTLRVINSFSPLFTAVELDISPSYLSQIENMKRVPSNKVIVKAAKLFNVTTESFDVLPTCLGSIRDLCTNHELVDIHMALSIIVSERLSTT